ncbi:unnamed protein product, partial [Musa acuminata var. zebrina]
NSVGVQHPLLCFVVLALAIAGVASCLCLRPTLSPIYRWGFFFVSSPQWPLTWQCKYVLHSFDIVCLVQKAESRHVEASKGRRRRYYIRWALAATKIGRICGLQGVRRHRGDAFL